MATFLWSALHASFFSAPSRTDLTFPLRNVSKFKMATTNNAGKLIFCMGPFVSFSSHLHSAMSTQCSSTEYAVIFADDNEQNDTAQNLIEHALYEIFT